ncbi:RNA polymerase sigma factor [Pseudoflavitalea rhizosphaerae]|uniref:RNA polymerase sigma factor n=1 Tax=Pseudoflavitalea rhizosphaerae TaxID=1884793 RepID=UPI0013DF17E1|nr:sigma-70 family RNA polymerase sigma factor [Pseudoflavitalea rhizosphaerae]
MNKELPNEKELLHLISEGDETAFARLFDRFKDDLYYLTLSLTKSAAAAEDVLQEVFLKIWLNRKELPSIDNFHGYLVVMTRRVILNQLRKLERQKNRELTVQQSMPTEITDDAVDRLQAKQYDSLLQSVLELIPTQQAAVFRLVKLRGLSREETASEMGLSPETVKKHLERAMKSIRAMLLVRMEDALLLMLAIIFKM